MGRGSHRTFGFTVEFYSPWEFTDILVGKKIHGVCISELTGLRKEATHLTGEKEQQWKTHSGRQMHLVPVW